MSDQTIEITPYNVAFYYVEFCKQKKVSESKIDNYIERMQQPPISDSVKEDFERKLYLIMQSIPAKQPKTYCVGYYVEFKIIITFIKFLFNSIIYIN